jgi:hypothetical protein
MLKTELISVHSLSWANEDHTGINCWIRTNKWLGEGPFNAVPNDVEPFGRELFWRFVNGEFGPIAENPPVGHPDHISYTMSAEGFIKYPDDFLPSRNLFEAWPEMQAFFDEANQENSRGTMRGIGLVWGSMLEHMLQRTLDLEKQSKVQGARFKGDFFKKIEAAYVRGWVSNEAKVDLHAIREIRNCCGHQWLLNFDNPKVRRILGCFERLQRNYVPMLNFVEDFEHLMTSVYPQSCMGFLILFADKQLDYIPK